MAGPNAGPHDKNHRVLFLCTGNSARSIMAECLMRRWGAGRFRAASAGSFPRDRVHPHALALLEKMNFRTDGLRPKSWDSFADEGARPFDFVITVCDRAAGEVCPVWPGQPIGAHWSVDDPAAVAGDERAVAKAFLNAYLLLEARIKLFTALPIASLDRLTLKKRLAEIARAENTAF